MRNFFLVVPVLGVEHPHGAFDEGAERGAGHSFEQEVVAGRLDDVDAFLVEIGVGLVDPYDRRRHRLALPDNRLRTVPDIFGHGHTFPVMAAALSNVDSTYVCTPRQSSS